MDAWTVQAILYTQEIWATHFPQSFSTTESHLVTSMMNAVEVLTTLQPPHSPLFPPFLTTQGPSGWLTATSLWQNMFKTTKSATLVLWKKWSWFDPHPAIRDNWEWLKHHPPNVLWLLEPTHHLCETHCVTITLHNPQIIQFFRIMWYPTVTYNTHRNHMTLMMASDQHLIHPWCSTIDS